MNIFCRCLSDSIFKKFKIEVDVFVFKKKKLVHIAFKRRSSSYCFFHELTNIIEHYWNERKYFFSGYQFTYPRLSQSLK